MAAAPSQSYPSNKDNTPYLTTNQGTRVYNNDHSLTVGTRGPVLIEDFHLLEKLQQFDREVAPERIVHARGMTAFGTFEVTHDISNLTSAAFLNGVGSRTETAVRFSVVTHGRDSPEGLRDVRGFATKFYTSEGNWDLVGNNIPVFFIRDGFKFPDLVHALRPNPRNNIQEAWRFLDFLSYHPESAHIMTWLAGMEGIPTDYRHMEGYGVNTFTLINAEGKETYVKFHWRPEEGKHRGTKFMTDDEAQNIGEFNMRHSHATQDLFNAIADGNFPKWSFYIQTLDPADEHSLDFDPLDCTKVWPEEDFPLQPVGQLTLDRNIDNFHNESEQIAFSPAVTVGGIGLSNDKVLQTRALSYSDTQRYRIGTNYQMLPINAPKCPFHNSHENGAMNFMKKTGEVNYWPSSLDNVQTSPNSKEAQNISTATITGQRVKQDIPEEKQNDFKQAGDRYRNMSLRESGQLIFVLSNWMADPKCTDEIRNRWLDIWGQVDSGLATALKAALVAQQPLQAVKEGRIGGHPDKMGASKA
ncbi:g10902 [Coccomyxa viridis]|uniref:catalase n=1 Tax=Coccomyxa viridis TaxID=1274662 RepID=A0ABP1G6N2_9CHLO